MYCGEYAKEWVLQKCLVSTGRGYYVHSKGNCKKKNLYTGQTKGRFFKCLF